MAKQIKNPIVVRQAKNKKTGQPINKFYWVLVGANGEDMAVSEMYTTRYGAERGKKSAIAHIMRYLQSAGFSLKKEPQA